MIIGIDFGTSTTVVRYIEEGYRKPDMIVDSNGNHIIPTVIYKNAAGIFSYGCEALTALESDKQMGKKGELFANFKMDLLEPEGSPKRALAEELILQFLSEHVYKLVSNQVAGVRGGESYDIAISYPAKWTGSMADFMVNAVKMAGFSPRKVIKMTEPEAAVINMLHNYQRELIQSSLLKVGKPLHIFTLDMGAGTTDITIFRFSLKDDGSFVLDNQLPYPPVDNPYLCGGREIDGILFSFVKEHCRKYGVTLDEEDFDVSVAKRWKDSFCSDKLKMNENVGFPHELLAPLRYIPGGTEALRAFYFDRNVYESITEEHWHNLYNLIKCAIRKYEDIYGIGAEGIDLLTITGGHSQWYTVLKLFNGEGLAGIGAEDDADGVKFTRLLDDPRRFEKFIDPRMHESVANGLCYVDEKIDIHQSSANNVWVQLVINDKESEVYKVVSQGRTLPCSEELTIDLGSIMKDYQRELDNEFRGYFKIYTGENFDDSRYDILNISLCLSFTAFCLGGDVYDVKAECKVTVEEGNTIKFDGNCNFTSTDPNILYEFLADLTKVVPFSNY